MDSEEETMKKLVELSMHLGEAIHRCEMAIQTIFQLGRADIEIVMAKNILVAYADRVGKEDQGLRERRKKNQED